MARKERVGTIDVGTSKICAVISEIDEGGIVDVLGLGLSPSVGIKRGVVIDIERNARAITTAVKRAEQMAGMKLDDVWVGVAGPHVSSQNAHGMVAVTGEKKEIKESDIKRAIDASQIISIPPEREILHVLPKEFLVDGNGGIKDPMGMSGVRLEVHSHIVTASTTSIENLIKSIEKSGLYVQGMVLTSLAAGESVLTDDERELGAVFIDIGGGTTDVAIFKEGGLVYNRVLAVGGTHVTNDIAVGLRTAVKSAEELKIKYGHAFYREKKNKEKKDHIKVLSASGKEERLVPHSLLQKIIEPRMIEIFSLIKQEIEKSGYSGLTPAGAVLTGGGSLLAGTSILAGGILDMPIRLGQPEGVKGLVELGEGASRDAGLAYTLAPPVFSTGVGLVSYGETKGRVKSQSKETVWSYLRKIGEKIKDTF